MLEEIELYAWEVLDRFSEWRSKSGFLSARPTCLLLKMTSCFLWGPRYDSSLSQTHGVVARWESRVQSVWVCSYRQRASIPPERRGVSFTGVAFSLTRLSRSCLTPMAMNTQSHTATFLTQQMNVSYLCRQTAWFCCECWNWPGRANLAGGGVLGLICETLAHMISPAVSFASQRKNTSCNLLCGGNVN